MHPIDHHLQGLIAVLLVLACAGPAVAQPTPDPLALGQQALAASDYASALMYLHTAADGGPKALRAEARYLLASIYLDTPLSDPRKARTAIRAAVDLAPDSVRYLALYLRQYQSDPHNRAARMERLSTQRSLARKILALDPDHPMGLKTAARLALDDLQWNTFAEHRFQTRYFARKSANAEIETEQLLRRLQTLQPDEPDAYRMLMRLYAYTQQYERALPILTLMQRHRPDDPDTYLYQGLVHHELTEADHSAQAFQQALATLPPQRRSPFEDLSRLDPGGYEAAGITDTARYVDAFWARRDPRRLTAANERRNAHYARLVLADLLYGQPQAGRYGWDTVPGDLIVRYGAPFNPKVAFSPYASAAGNLDGGLKSWSYGDFTLVLEDPYRNGAFRFYSPSVRSDGSAGSHFSGADYELVARSLFREMPEQYNHEEPGRRVDLPYLASTFRGYDGRSDVYVAYAIPLELPNPTRTDIDVALETGAFLLDSTGVGPTSRKPLWRLPATGLVAYDSSFLWVDVHHLKAPTGIWDLLVEFETAAHDVVGYQHQTLKVNGFSAPGLKMSDLMLAYLVEDTGTTPITGRIERDGLSIWASPWGVFSPDQPIYLYLELYDLTLGLDGRSRYVVEAALTPEDDRSGLRRLAERVFGRGDPKTVSVRFEAGGARKDEAQYFILDAADAASGTYHLDVRITDLLTSTTVTATRMVYLFAP